MSNLLISVLLTCSPTMVTAAVDNGYDNIYNRIEHVLFVLESDPDNLDYLIKKYSYKYDLDPDIVRSIVYVESKGNPNAYNKGAVGLMQVTHIASKQVGLSNLDKYDPENNLDIGCAYLRYLLDSHFNNDYDKALRAYNTGPSRYNIPAGHRYLVACKNAYGNKFDTVYLN